MQVLCRVDANETMGIGHLMRCLALAQAFESQDIPVTFILRNASKLIFEQRDDRCGSVIVIADDIDLADETCWIKDNVNLENFGIILLDGYQFSSQYRCELSLLKKLVIFDDNNNSGKPYADLIINSLGSASSLNYKQTAESAELCLGLKYRVLRSEFSIDSVPKLADRDYLTIIMGGSDILNVTLPLLRSLEALKVVFNIKVITGPVYPHVEELQSFIDQSSISIEHLHNNQSIAKNFLESKLVVSAAGSTQYELLACECPAIIVIVAKNQTNSAGEAENSGWCIKYNYLENPNANELALKVIELWNDTQCLEKMSIKANHLKDILGCKRIVERVKALVE